ncbi:MAG: valine--tRNA ligase [Parcubacteria group bacterium]|nr:valine--tRNA ligase [Parcubacteria group bacterium]
MNELPKTYDPSAHEEKIYRLWEEGGFFKPQKSKVGKKYMAWMAPPNITGILHMGHALENTLLDVLVRKRRMQGYETVWIPGTDHAGIATQNVVEKELKKEGVSRHDLGREKFEARVWEWRNKYGDIILDQFKKLGVSPDWSRLAFTLDPSYQKAVFTAFEKYHREGWIYRARKVINWCPRCSTSISDLEVEHREEPSKLWYINYPLREGGHIQVATTRPETMLGDTAVAVNPSDERYKKLVGKIAILPIQERKIPIVADMAVDPKFGTGAVKVTPAHDTTDYEISLRHKLPMVEVIDARGRMTNDAGQSFAGLKTLEAREKVVEKLKGLGLLEKTEGYTVSAGVCERCGSKIEPIPSWQWFLKMEKLAELGSQPIEKKLTRLEPARWEKPYLEWLKNVRDWPISRQLWWGHRLPAWFCEEELKKPTEAQRYVVTAEKPTRCGTCGKCEMAQSPDVLDTWFSSALWPFATLGWPKETDDLKNYYPGTTISSAPEILYLWIARMIFSGMYFMKKSPFAIEYVHATVLTKEGRRMSKSLGTGIDPLELITKYGADATRFGLVWQATGTQAIHFDEGVVQNGKKFANKLWNAARFITMRPDAENINVTTIQCPNEHLTEEDQHYIEELRTAVETYEKDTEEFRFGQATETLYHFIWHTFCDKYLEYAKKEARPEVNKLLVWSLTTFLKLLHPIMPFLTETIWQELPPTTKSPLIVQSYPEVE